MPHRRRKKKEPETRLIFEPAFSSLYLSVLSVTEDVLLVPLDTFLVLSVIKQVGADAEDQFNLHLVPEPQSQQLWSVAVHRESVLFDLVDGNIPQPVANCR